jgi:hypothetical protein
LSLLLPLLPAAAVVAIVIIFRAVAVIVAPVISRFSLVGLSREVEALREAPSAAAPLLVEREAGAAGEAAAAAAKVSAAASHAAHAAHHLEQDVGVDAAAHAAAAAEHVGRVGQVHAAVIALALPAGC